MFTRHTHTVHTTVKLGECDEFSLVARQKEVTLQCVKMINCIMLLSPFSTLGLVAVV